MSCFATSNSACPGAPTKAPLVADASDAALTGGAEVSCNLDSRFAAVALTGAGCPLADFVPIANASLTGGAGSGGVTGPVSLASLEDPNHPFNIPYEEIPINGAFSEGLRAMSEKAQSAFITGLLRAAKLKDHSSNEAILALLIAEKTLREAGISDFRYLPYEEEAQLGHAATLAHPDTPHHIKAIIAQVFGVLDAMEGSCSSVMQIWYHHTVHSIFEASFPHRQDGDFKFVLAHEGSTTTQLAKWELVSGNWSFKDAMCFDIGASDEGLANAPHVRAKMEDYLRTAKTDGYNVLIGAGSGGRAVPNGLVATHPMDFAKPTPKTREAHAFATLIFDIASTASVLYVCPNRESYYICTSAAATGEIDIGGGKTQLGKMKFEVHQRLFFEQAKAFLEQRLAPE